MSGWDIDPNGVSGVLLGLEAEVDDNLSPGMTGCVNALNGAITATNGEGKAMLVASAVSEWSSMHEADFTGIGDRIGNITSNTIQAVSAYQQHDESAALEFQRNAK
ncbi:DUF6507 family protein [Actinomyces weissii]|uniref:ESX-1 secretion-associated protein n=1 Tax=Actinomyces weissii TaxID=675090 RepID=A0A7T7S221_9ACTO|nr:DUF6507 family protein [Actinomyces weissii]QQM67546.1 hypothetical protein JG540_01180 [Actinomyces weissii]